MREPCFECGSPSEADHHVVPRILGGTRTVPLCGKCHSRIHGISPSARALTQLALDQKRANGEHVGGGVPYGCRMNADGIHLDPEPSEQAVITEAKRLRSTGLSMRKIGDALAASGVMARNGKPFFAAQIQGMLIGGRKYRRPLTMAQFLSSE